MKRTVLKDQIVTESSESTMSADCREQEHIQYYYYENYDAMWQKNNKFGMYVYAENTDFIEKAEELINSNGGEWGYVLIPYNVKDRDSTKWEKVFSKLNSDKLIPIIQLWDVTPEKYKDQTQDAADFLNSFVWPIRYRYVSVYNEPNDSKFWYGRIDPAEYAKILSYTIKAFKDTNPNYFMLNGAFNVTAANDSHNMDAFSYMLQMDKEIPGIFNQLDGWASHSYPQPNFSGSPKDTGRGSIRAYDVELRFLKDELNVTKELPVFITETGWAHAEGEKTNNSYLGIETVSKYFRSAFEDVWLKDDRVRAVTPFTIWYEPPFDHFSWINRDKVPYAHFDALKKVPKVKGKPPVLRSSTIVVKKEGCLN